MEVLHQQLPPQHCCTHFRCSSDITEIQSRTMCPSSNFHRQSMMNLFGVVISTQMLIAFAADLEKYLVAVQLDHLIVPIVAYPHQSIGGFRKGVQCNALFGKLQHCRWHFAIEEGMKHGSTKHEDTALKEFGINASSTLRVVVEDNPCGCFLFADSKHQCTWGCRRWQCDAKCGQRGIQCGCDRFTKDSKHQCTKFCDQIGCSAVCGLPGHKAFLARQKKVESSRVVSKKDHSELYARSNLRTWIIQFYRSGYLLKSEGTTGEANKPTWVKKVSFF